MESLKKNKTLIIVLVVTVIAFLVYQFKDVLIADSEVAPVDTTITTSILSALSELQQAKIDSELFTSSAWTNLVDYSIVLPTDAPGRPELFGTTLGSTGGFTAPATTTKR